MHIALHKQPLHDVAITVSFRELDELYRLALLVQNLGLVDPGGIARRLSDAVEAFRQAEPAGRPLVVVGQGDGARRWYGEPIGADLAAGPDRSVRAVYDRELGRTHAAELIGGSPAAAIAEAAR